MIRNLLFSFLFLFVSCQSSKEENKPIILVSITPYKVFIEQIVKEFALVESVVPANQNPHFFTPSIKQVTKIGRANIYYRIGENFEGKILPSLLEKNPEMTVVDLRRNISLIPIDPHHRCHNCTHGHYDIHFWLSPEIVKVQLDQIKKSLIFSFPEKKDLIDKRVETLKNKLTALQKEIKKLPLNKKTFLSSHEAFAYFCKEYGCKEIALEMGQKEATAKYIEEIFAASKMDQINLMVLIPQVNDKGARRVAEKLSINSIIFDPYAKNYFDNLLYLAKNIGGKN